MIFFLRIPTAIGNNYCLTRHEFIVDCFDEKMQ